jgi:hypothetical protein
MTRSFTIDLLFDLTAAMLLRYPFHRVGLTYFTILISGFYVFDSSPANAQATSVKTISISMQPQIPISNLMYGANYVWTETPASQFPSWISQMTGYAAQPSAPVSLFRYPGGTDGEWYDWVTNGIYPGGPSYTAPGEPPDEFLEYIPSLGIISNPRAATFVLQSRDVITTKTPAEIPALISQSISGYLSLMSIYQGNVRYWEIGNEWWLQKGANHTTAPLSSNTLLTQNLTRYAELVAAAAPQIKAAYPNVKIYATADWTTAGLAADNDEFVQLRNLVGPAAWALIDGISIHTYCGTTNQKSLCASIPAQVKAIEQDTGKSDIFASEWSVGPSQSTDDFGIQNASLTVSALQDMAMAGIDKASYWPSIGFNTGIELTTGTNLTPTGMLFRAMSLLYEGEALPAHVSVDSGPAGQTVAVAAENNLNGKNGIAVIIPSNGDGLETINLSLAGTGMTSVASSSVLYAQYPNSGTSDTTAFTVPLSTTILHQSNGSLEAQFVLNPGITGRGSNWEIASIELQ